MAVTDAWQLTLVAGDLATGLRPVADRLAGRSLGLALAGGGARAFAHVGVLRELEEAGLHVDRVTGASIGAVIAGVHATGADGATLEEVCYAEFVRRRPFSDYRLSGRSLARGRRVRTAMERHYGVDTMVEGLYRQLSMVSVDLVSRTPPGAPTRKPARRGDRVGPSARAVRAARTGTTDGCSSTAACSTTCRPTCSSSATRARSWPSRSLSGGDGPRRPGRPRVPGLGDTLMRTMMIGSGGAGEAARGRGAWVVGPSSMGVGLLEFHQYDRMVQSGRTAARALLEQASGDLGVHPLAMSPGDLGTVSPTGHAAPDAVAVRGDRQR